MANLRTQEDWARTALRLPRDLHRAVHAAARAQERTFNGQIVVLLRSALLPRVASAAAVDASVDGRLVTDATSQGV